MRNQALRRMAAVGPGTPGELAARSWNEKHAVGTCVRYYSVIGRAEYKETATRSAAWQMPSGEPVVMVDGVAGCVTLRAVQVQQ